MRNASSHFIVPCSKMIMRPSQLDQVRTTTRPASAALPLVLVTQALRFSYWENAPRALVAD